MDEIKKKKETIYDCEKCGLYLKCNTPKMKVTGNGNKKILIIAEAPGKTEDELGLQLVGIAGKFLRKTLRTLGYNLNNDFWKTNAVICRPPDNRKPTKKEIKCCRIKLLEVIESKKPEKIIVFGSTALEALTNETSISKYIGQEIPDQDLKCWIFPMYHPSYLLRNIDDKITHKQFKVQLKKAIKFDTPFKDNSNLDQHITIIDNPFEAVLFLEQIGNILPESIISIDIETTGIKPHANEHEIICIAIATNYDEVKVFPCFKDRKFIFELKKVLRNNEIKKIAHNIKFENTWFKTILKAKTNNWYWDTMIVAHILDNRGGTTGLKIQSYFNYGIKGYGEETNKYIKSKEKSGNAFNAIKECDQKKLMIYCAKDALLTWKLWNKQELFMCERDLKAYTLFHKGLIELSKIEQNGIEINEKYYYKQKYILTEKMDSLTEKIKNSEEVKKWKGEKEFKHTSNENLTVLLFDILNLVSVKKTANNNPSIDVEVLEVIDLPFIKYILKWRKLKKIRDTYINGILKESVNNKIHCSFNLNMAATYRSSCSSPNLQNIPVHDEVAKNIVRTGIVSTPGNILMEIDYSGIEVCVSACYHKDPAMIKYIKDAATDMHRDQAMKIYIMDKEQITKETRYIIKNNFVFPQFYGSWWKECAENIWNAIDNKIKVHLAKNGINKLGKIIRSNENKIIGCTGFYFHIKKIEHDFWNKKFKIYNQWKKDTWEKYQKIGVIETLTGFTLKREMKKNDALNYAIQGSAFHCLLWSLTTVNKFLTTNKYKTKIVNQIHDSIVFDMDPNEKEELLPVIIKIMTQDIKKEFSWIIVPLEVDVEVSKINGNWAEMEKISF